MEIAPGRGDLRYSSWLPFIPYSLGLVGRTMSFAQLFCTQPWIAAAVMRMLTWSIRVPLKVYRKVGDENSRVRLNYGEHPLATAVCRPTDDGYMASLVMNMLGPLLVHGNSVTEIVGPLDTMMLMPRDWRYARPIMPFRDALEGFEFDIDDPAMQRPVSIDNVLHVKWWSPIGPIGCSPLEQLGTTLNIEDAAQRYQINLFRNGARPPSAIEASEEFLGLEPSERQEIMQQLREDVTTLYGGPENGGRPALLPPGLQWKPVGHSAVEAALIEQRYVTREEIAGVYQIPPPMLGILQRATYSNIETQREMTYTDCVGPPLVLCEQIINARIARELLQEDDVYAQFDFGAVLRGSALDEINAIREAVSTAILTPNEGRDLRNMPRSGDDGMDSFYLPFNNLQPVGHPPVPGVQPTQPPPRQAPGKPPQPPQQARTIHVRSRDADYDYELMGAEQ